MTTAEIIQIVIGILSLVATIAVSFLIYWLQTRHEKEIQKLQDEKEQKGLETKARLFLIDNEPERDYLPWCVVAANVHPLERHSRKIIRNIAVVRKNFRMKYCIKQDIKVIQYKELVGYRNV